MDNGQTHYTYRLASVTQFSIIFILQHFSCSRVLKKVTKVIAGYDNMVISQNIVLCNAFVPCWFCIRHTPTNTVLDNTGEAVT